MRARLLVCVLVMSAVSSAQLLTDASPLSAEEQAQQSPSAAEGTAPSPVLMKEVPVEMAEGSNKCEIVSCGAGLKETCQVDCPAGKTPKCSCDCIRNIGPLCMEYKANCRCE
jgi:hypothetical protein